MQIRGKFQRTGRSAPDLYKNDNARTGAVLPDWRPGGEEELRR